MLKGDVTGDLINSNLPEMGTRFLDIIQVARQGPLNPASLFAVAGSGKPLAKGLVMIHREDILYVYTTRPSPSRLRLPMPTRSRRWPRPPSMAS